MMSGKDRFGAIADSGQRDTLAADFMGQLAALHRIDVAANPVEGMGPVESADIFIRRRIAGLRAGNEGKAWDPLIHLSLNWLEANIPANMPAPVIVHGDSQPRQFPLRRGPRHRAARLGTRPLRRPDGRSRDALPADALPGLRAASAGVRGL
ncbi:phosphotransferase [Sphingopyxis sp. PET50]|uniref:phosphotransferase n=1 Tax=Sphingopyxis sp. PET50 TaxID=2976533 RepID=UPI0021AF21DA|nr:phosphotransferase [Sphingopyxis sp. PET50]